MFFFVVVKNSSSCFLEQTIYMKYQVVFFCKIIKSILECRTSVTNLLSALCFTGFTFKAWCIVTMFVFEFSVD